MGGKPPTVLEPSLAQPQGAPETSVQPFQWGAGKWGREGPCSARRPRSWSSRGSGHRPWAWLVPSVQKAAAPWGPRPPLRWPRSPRFQALFRGAEVVPCGNFSLGCWALLGCLPWIVSPNGAPGGLGDPHRVLRSADQAALWKVSIRSPGPRPWRQGGGHLRPHSKSLTDPQGWDLHLSSPSLEVFLL